MARKPSPPVGPSTEHVRPVLDASDGKLAQMEWIMAVNPVGVACCGWCGGDHVVELGAEHLPARLTLHYEAVEPWPETIIERTRSGKPEVIETGRMLLQPAGPVCPGSRSLPGERPPEPLSERETKIRALIREHVSWSELSYDGDGMLDGVEAAASAIEALLALATPPSSAKLNDALREIADEATGSGLLQPGAAFALGTLAEACDVKPGAQPEDVAAALSTSAVT